MERLTLDQLEALPAEVLTCAQVTPVLLQALERPELLGFPVIVAGSRVKIPKRPFIRFMREGI